MSDVAMPRLSDSMEEGTILKWLKSDGDEVSKGEELVEIETDKANMTYEADESGTLEIVAQEGDTLPVGETIARIGEGGGGSSDDDEDEEEEEPEATEDGEDEDDDVRRGRGATTDEEAEDERGRGRATKTSPTRTRSRGASESRARSDDEDEDERVKASPIARRMAREKGLDLVGDRGHRPRRADREVRHRGRRSRRGAGAGGSAEEEEAPKPPPTQGRGDISHVELTRLQRTVARRMAESKATAPDFVMTLEVDMEEAVALRGQLKAAAGEDARRRPSTTS